jgi:EAL domain-containing protein (putative c-di-GMP-specific phosphodiesterase class I)
VEPFIQELIARLMDTPWVDQLFKRQANSPSDLVNPVLSVIRSTSQADGVFLLKQDTYPTAKTTGSWLLAGYSDIEGQISQTTYLEQIKTQVLPLISEQALFSTYHHGITLNHDGQLFILIPIQPSLIQKSSIRQFMIVCHPKLDAALLNEIYGHILCVFYQACQMILLRAFPIEVATALIEATVLDGLKQASGFVSKRLYDRRFALFESRLQQMVVYFEPILELDQVQIFGWEALARDPFSGKSDKLVAPVDLFKSAELWGTEFTTELDLHFLRCATETYQRKRQEKQLNRSSDIRPLSINVYPATLMRTVYRETLRQIIKEEKLIDGANLTLEISEKTELPEPEDRHYSEPYWAEYRRKLKQHMKDFRVRFAIDDFGVGYASVARLAGLRPTYVKIDREVLLASSIEALRLTIDYINELLLELGSGSVIIVEGVEGQPPFDLKTLKEIGVNYIQGHLVGKASADIQQRLTREEYEFFKEQMEDF